MLHAYLITHWLTSDARLTMHINGRSGRCRDNEYYLAVVIGSPEERYSRTLLLDEQSRFPDL